MLLLFYICIECSSSLRDSRSLHVSTRSFSPISFRIPHCYSCSRLFSAGERNWSLIFILKYPVQIAAPSKVKNLLCSVQTSLRASFRIQGHVENILIICADSNRNPSVCSCVQCSSSIRDIRYRLLVSKIAKDEVILDLYRSLPYKQPSKDVCPTELRVNKVRMNRHFSTASQGCCAMIVYIINNYYSRCTSQSIMLGCTPFSWLSVHFFCFFSLIQVRLSLWDI